MTVTGGKWTTYRLMAEHAVDAAVRVAAKADASVAARAGPCVTDAVAVLGAHGHRAGLAQTILMENARGVLEDSNANAFARRKRKTRGGEARARTTLDDADVVEHLVRAYGDRARRVVDLARSDDALAKRLAPAHPTLVAEVVYAAREEILSDDARLFGAQVAPRVPGRRRRRRRARGERGARERTRMGLVQGGEGAAGDEGVPTYVSVLTRVPDAEKQ